MTAVPRYDLTHWFISTQVVTADVSHVPMSSLNWAAFQGGVFRGVELRAQHGADGVRPVPGGGL